MSSGLGWPGGSSSSPDRVGWPQDAAVAELSPLPDKAEIPNPSHPAEAADVSRETVASAQPPPLPTPDVSHETSSSATDEPLPDEAAAIDPAPSALPPPLPTPDVSRETSSPATDEPLPDEAAAIDLASSALPLPLPTPDVSRETPLLEDEPVVSTAPVADEEVSRETALPVADSGPAPAPPGPWPRPHHRRVMTVANQKGGVGKTTSTVNLAAALALRGVRVLVIDLDPQGNASTAFSVAHPAGTPSIYDVLIGETTLAEVCVPVEGFSHLWCAPATIDLAGAEIELVSLVARETRLRRALDSVPDVDYVFIDCPPSLGLLTLNAMVAASEVLIPIQCEFYALEGLTQLLNNVELVKKHLNAELVVSTILLTMYDARTRLAEQVANDVRAHFGELVIDAVIPRSVRISEAPGFGQPVVTFDPASRGARAYFEAAYDLAQRGASTDATDNVIPREEGQA